MPKKPMTMDIAQKWLSENMSHVSILEWGGSSQAKSKFYDKNRISEFEMNFTNLKIHFKEGRDIGSAKTSKVEVENWLKKNQPHIKLLEWGGSASLNSKFFDENRNTEFLINFRQMKSGFLNNEKFIPRASKEELKEAVVKTNMEKYGVVSNFQLASVKNKIKETCLKKYGFSHPSKNQKVKEKNKQSNIKNGKITLIDGKTISEIAKEKDVSITTVSSFYKNFGKEFLNEYQKKYTSIEFLIKNIFEKNSVKYLHNKGFAGLRPDFLIEEKKLIVECNGLYWHSEEILKTTMKDKFYHKNKKEIYTAANYKSLFFNEDEIRDKTEIVESIILHNLGLSKYKIAARKCSLEKLTNKEAADFFECNHLMGKGAGEIFCLKQEGKIVSAMQVKWKNKDLKEVEISRFCNLLNYNVQGSFSRLLNFVIKDISPNIITTFIDQRYGSGDYLKNLNFTKENESLSFKWTDFKKTYHRMTFPSNSGYINGMYKIWDCGQTKWSLKCKPTDY